MLSPFSEGQIEKLTTLRRQIHALPELSFQEHNTKKTLIKFLQELKNAPKIIPDVGGGFLAEFDFNTSALSSEKAVVLRCELDAIPTEETNDFDHKSSNHGAAHLCGHDGHMAILAGIAVLLSDHYAPKSGKVVLLFQPAEETGAGAQQMASSSVLAPILKSPESSFYALHNVPGFPSRSIVLPKGNSFASASKGMHIKLKGRSTHASQPRMGKNPVLAMCNIIQGLLSLPSLHIAYDEKALVTIVGAKAGEKAFGIAAGDAEVMATLRATTDAALDALDSNGVSLVNGISSAYGLTSSIVYEDIFPATVNHPECVTLVKNAADKCNMNVIYLDEAFPWSEDFGIFLQHAKGAMFALGAGKDHQPLHDEKYDFPDSEIIQGVNIFAEIIVMTLDQQ